MLDFEYWKIDKQFRPNHLKEYISNNPGLSQKDINEYIVTGILQDKQNLLWLLTNKGLSIYYPNTNQIRNFTTEDGCVKFTNK